MQQYKPINPVCRVCGVSLDSENFNESIKGLGHFKDSKDLLLRAVAYIGEDSYTD